MNDQLGLFEKFLATENAPISISGFIVNGIIIVLLSYILERTYAKCARSISNRKLFAANFMIIAFTTMLIITIVKSSLALSLGLVGALSIVRFRSAIKEPEELAYLFLTISIGLGLGANQRAVVIVAFFVILGIVWVRYFMSRKKENQNLFFTVSSDTPGSIKLADILSVVRTNFDAVELNRFDESSENIEASFLVEIADSSNLESAKNQLQQLSDSVKITFIDNKHM